MKEFAIAVKGLIINSKNEVLLVKRRPNDVHAPAVWEIPGGRLDSYEENPFDGLKREIKEETALEVNVENPLYIDHFARDDGQRITMLIFLCRTLSENVVLSEEHTDFVWKNVSDAKELIVHHFHPVIDNFKKFFL